LLDGRVSFQFLTHPDTWGSRYRSMDDALSDMMKTEINAVRAQYEELAKYYGQLLQERGTRDEQFRRRRTELAKQIGDGQDNSECN